MKRERFAIDVMLIVLIIVITIAVISGFNRGYHFRAANQPKQKNEITVESESKPEKKMVGKTVYTVEAGDTPWGIAESYCDGDLDLLYELNPGMKELNFILPGDTFFIPVWSE